MSHTEDFQKVIDFAEGTLDPSQEDQLFLKLSADDELRQEFKSHMSIKNAVRAGAAGVVLPAASKAAVFSKLGLQLPVATAATVGVGAGSGIIAFLTNRKTIATAISLAVVSLIFIISSMNEDTVKPHNGDFAGLKSNDSYGRIPVISSLGSESDTPTNSSVSEKVALAPKSQVDEEEVADVTTSDNIAFASYSNAVTNESMMTNGSKMLNQQDLTSDYPLIQNDIKIQGNNIFSIEFRSSNYFNTQKPTISPSEYSPLNNLALAIMYNANKNLSIGADVRQETFFLEYNGTNNGEEYIYQQQPNFTTFSGLVRYKMEAWNGFRPFGQLSAGANSVGFVGRAMLGLEYSAFSNFAFMLSFDFNNLTYSH